MLLIRQKMIYRSDLQANPNVLYVFGDNLDRVGMGGQAGEMRGEPNAFGIATKRAISHGYPQDYFFDTQEDSFKILKSEFERLHKELSNVYATRLGMPSKFKRWKAIVVPSDGLGTGLSRLPETAPKLLAYIDEQIELLKDL